MPFWRWFSFSQGGICESPGGYSSKCLKYRYPWFQGKSTVSPRLALEILAPHLQWRGWFHRRLDSWDGESYHVFAYIYHRITIEIKPNAGTYAIHGSYGQLWFCWEGVLDLPSRSLTAKGPEKWATPNRKGSCSNRNFSGAMLNSGV